ncbi:putative RNA-directed DNA polymerase from transposon X-element, partial [Trichonephila clavipes]
LASWNANGIKSRIVEVRDFIDKHHPDVFLIQESHLGPGDNIHIPNYTVYRNDRPRTTSNLSRGGTANRDYRLGGLSKTPKSRPLHFSSNHCAHGGRRRHTSCRPHRRDHKHTRTLFQADSRWEFLLRFEEIRQLTIERNRARKVWQFTRDPSDKRVLNNIQNRIHRNFKAFQNKTWEDELRALDPDDGSLWEMSKELRKKKSPVYALNGQGGIAHTDSDKAEVIACSLEKQFQENNIPHPSDFIINRVVENYFLNENNFDAPSPPSHALGGS